MPSNPPAHARPPSAAGELLAWLRLSCLTGLGLALLVLAAMGLSLVIRFNGVLTAEGRGVLASERTAGSRGGTLYVLTDGALLNAPLAGLKAGDRIEKRRFRFTYTVNNQPVSAIAGWGRHALITAGVVGGLGFSFFILVGALATTLTRVLQRGSGHAS